VVETCLTFLFRAPEGRCSFPNLGPRDGRSVAQVRAGRPQFLCFLVLLGNFFLSVLSLSPPPSSPPEFAVSPPLLFAGCYLRAPSPLPSLCLPASCPHTPESRSPFVGPLWPAPAPRSLAASHPSNTSVLRSITVRYRPSVRRTVLFGLALTSVVWKGHLVPPCRRQPQHHRTVTVPP